MDDYGLSQMLNNYFSFVFNQEAVSFNLDLLQVEHIYKGDQQNKLLVANKAPGVDRLVSNVFINTADSISLP